MIHTNSHLWNFQVPMRFEELQVLSKDEIGKLHGGRFRGENVFLAMERGSITHEFHKGIVLNQWRSQRWSSFPEGSIRIRTEQGKTFNYDIASGTIMATQFEWCDLHNAWRRVRRKRKAWILRYAPRTPKHEILKHYAERCLVEEKLFSLILSLPAEDQKAVILLVREELGLDVTLGASASEELGLLKGHYLPVLPVQYLSDLEGLLAAHAHAPFSAAA